MKGLVSGVAMAALVMATVPAWSQSTSSQSIPQNNPTGQQNAPDAAGVSKPGVAGQPGNKNGPSPSSGTSTPQATTGATQLQDTSRVQGLPGSKSGPSTKAPGQGAAGSSESGSTSSQSNTK